MKTLCIGGPLDGKYVGTDAPHFTYADEAPKALTTALTIPRGDVPVKPGAYAIHEYTLQSIAGGGQLIRFYCLDGITPWGAVVRVFTAYGKRA